MDSHCNGSGAFLRYIIEMANIELCHIEPSIECNYKRDKLANFGRSLYSFGFALGYLVLTDFLADLILKLVNLNTHCPIVVLTL